MAIEKQPPLNKPILLRLFDKWLGKGNEIETVTAIYNGRIYKTTGGKQIHQGFITGWKDIT